jgi:hypothetical protein
MLAAAALTLLLAALTKRWPDAEVIPIDQLDLSSLAQRK